MILRMMLVLLHQAQKHLLYMSGACDDNFFFFFTAAPVSGASFQNACVSRHYCIHSKLQTRMCLMIPFDLVVCGCVILKKI